MSYTRLFDIFNHQLQYHPQPDSLVSKINGKWEKLSTAEVVSQIEQLATGLYFNLQLQYFNTPEEKQKVALISNNRPEWNILDNATQRIGVVNVPIYPTITDEEMQFIFNDSQIVYAFVSDEKLYQKVKSIQPNVPSLKDVFTFNEVANAKNWKSLLINPTAEQKEKVDAISNKITADELATIIYTSGTTGKPKGVMLSHKNILANVESCVPILLLPLNENDRALSFLPLCHIFERMVSYLLMTEGVSIYYAESIDTIGDNLKEVHPSVFTTVPRLLEKVYDRIMAKGAEQVGLKKKIFYWAVNLGLTYEHDRKNGWWYHLQLSLADKLVFSKWREALGSSVKVIVSGGAALQPRLARIFTAAGVPVLEGYGLSETSPVIAVNRPEPHGACFTTVGPAISGVELRFAADGEIIVKGDNIMMGYYKQPEKTAEVIDADGYFHTGDIGELVDNKFLKITDRKKELFKTSGGKYVSPAALENKLKESIYVEQAMVIGDGEKFVGALIIPNYADLKKWCKANNILFGNDTDITNSKEVQKLFRGIIDEMNKNFNHVEQIKKFRLLHTEWSINGGELTPKLSMKRKVIMERCKESIESMYRKNTNI
ncbi:MAG: hypothetical protein RJA07_591 [Bacteroidota bacterium]|jgi:long-chain acyl-CoA synthetase